jgi:urea transport system permease protein
MAFSFASREARTGPSRYIITAVLFALLFAAPFILPEFRLNLLARFLTYAIVALGLDLLWGYTGILSLGHGVYFGLGAYCMAMYLKLEASGGKMPDFMAWSGVNDMPWWWKPFNSPVFAIGMALLFPMILGGLIGYAAFRNRIKGVFFSILSQALALVVVTLFEGQQGYTGGTNGMTNFKTFLGLDLNVPHIARGLYWATAILMFIAYFGCRILVNGKVGKIMVAIRDGENRARFIGYNPVAYQTFVYALSAFLAGLAGMLFVLQEGLIEPKSMNIMMSINMVLWVAIGGRGTLIGAVLGAIFVNTGSTLLSEKFPETWLYFLGFTFIAVVLFLPQGVVGWWLKFSDSPRLSFLKNMQGRVVRDGSKNAVENAA